MYYWEPGKKLKQGKYIVETRLGIGGFGVTYRVREESTGKLLVVKTLNRSAREREDFEEFQDKFVNETIILASCNHPYIVKVYPQSFRESGLFCMVMEYIEGGDLDCYIKQKGRLSESQAIDIIKKVSSALSLVHENGFLHRDVKPNNILLRKSDLSPVLIDFGLARELSIDKVQSMTNAISECFAPIEQYGRRGNFGPWTDIYALAATLYFLLTAELPLPSHYRQSSSLAPPQQHNPNLSDSINQAILQGMELQPENRPQSVEEWLKLLQQPSRNKIFNKDGVVEEENHQNNQGENKNVTIPPTKIIGNQQITILATNNIWQPSKDQNLLNFGDSSVPLQILEFETVKINDKGKIITQRHLTANYFTENLGKTGGFLSKKITLEMVAIPGGSFMMGVEHEEIKRLIKKFSYLAFPREQPRHQVTVAPFYMGKFPVTQEQWKVVAALPQVKRALRANPSEFPGDNLPVERVSWYDAVEFCARLSKYTGKEYRLPSEAEWEYACRAGTTTSFHFGETITSELANYKGDEIYAKESKGTYREKTTPVGSFTPNSFGLYDMHGNIWEWCADTWHANYQGAPNDGSVWREKNDNHSRVLRGGSWGSMPKICRSAHRIGDAAGSLNFFFGFRCVVSRNS